MPIFEYRCSECGEVFDRLVRASDDRERAVCPACGATTATRLISAFAISHNLTPCGSRASDAPLRCGLGSGEDACSSCCRRA